MNLLLNEQTRPLAISYDKCLKSHNIDIIYLDGPVGCGKTTKMINLKSDKTIIIEEPIELWNLDKEINIITESVSDYELEIRLKYDYIVNIVVKVVESIAIKQADFDKIIIERSIFDHEFFGSCDVDLFNKDNLKRIFNWIHYDLLQMICIKSITIFQPYNIISNLNITDYEKLLIKVHNNKKSRGRLFELNYNINYIIQLNRFTDRRYISKYLDAIDNITPFNIKLEDEIYYIG